MDSRSWLVRALLVTSLLTAYTGLFNRAGFAWTIPYRVNAVLHPVLGLAALFLGLALLVRGPLRRHPWRGLALGLPLFLLALLAAAMPSPAPAILLIVLLALYCVHSGVVATLIPLKSAGVQPLRRLLAEYLWVASTYSGLAILARFQEGNGRLWFQIHAVHGLLLAAVIPFVLQTRRQRAFYLSACGLIVLAGAFSMPALWRTNLSTESLNKRTEREEDIRPAGVDRATLAFLDVTEGCGGDPACHPGIVTDHLLSNHNVGYRTDHFQKNLSQMASEVGEENTVICAGCHTPQAVFDRTLGFRDFRTRNNMSCVFCHVVTDASSIPELPGKSWYELRPEFNHLQMFDPAGGPVGGLTKLEILLNAPGHARVFGRGQDRDDRLCLACHNRQMPEPAPIGLNGPTCVRCHMQPRAMLFGEGPRKSHLFLGNSLSAPYFLDYPDRLAWTRAWATGEVVPGLAGWQDAWQLRQSDSSPYAKAPWIVITFMPRGPVVPGAPFELEVMTSNVVPGHSFPGGPLDLSKAWLELRITDAGGSLLFSSGGLEENGDISEGTVKLGGRLIADDGRTVLLNEVWRLQGRVIDEVIPGGRDARHSFRFEVPRQIQGPVRVTAAWKYRKINPEFFRWAYPDRSMADYPSLTMGEASFVLPSRQAGEE